MADQDKQQAQQESQVVSAKPAKGEAATSDGGITVHTWLLLGVVTLLGSSGGVVLSQLIGDPAAVESKLPQETPGQDNKIDAMLAEQASQSPWVEEFEPVLANLDEPGVTRYVRVTISLEMSPELDEVKGRVFLETKKMLVRDWMTTYLAGLSLEDVRGSRNLNRIKKDVLDECNKLLFPDSQPFIKRIFFKEFAVQ